MPGAQGCSGSISLFVDRVAKCMCLELGTGQEVRERGRAEVQELALTCRPSPLPLDATH